MSLILHIIRDHYSAIHRCDGQKEIKVQIEGKYPKGNPLLIQNCGVISEYFFDKIIPLKCKKCGEEYILSKEHFEPAKAQYQKFMEQLKK